MKLDTITSDPFGSESLPRLPLSGFLLAFGRSLRALLSLLGPIRLRGAEHLPPGPFILASNHLSYLDSPVLLTLVSFGIGTPVAPAATRGLFVFPLTLILKRIGAIPINRRSGDNVESLRRMLESLKSRPLLMFPEGGRQRNGVARPSRPGLGFLALAAGVPVVPARLTGTDRVLRRLPRRTSMTLTLGSPLVFRKEDYAGTPTMQAQAAVVGQVMQAIGNLE